MTFLGDKGLPVFQAGHWDWQRPHSVQLVKSSRPFQVKSSILPAPKGSSSGSASSKSKGLVPEASIIGLAAALEGLPSALRLKKMLTGATKRCQPIPMVRRQYSTTKNA